ncbi:SAM-dependent methyltransferase [Geminicoccus harenae]|uniref:SAM-dependent methyltransferase n=1 Tax=Geminicoccus harenae TaxID=2498453 RepID=UPI00168ADE37|nr:class I SAM-dependent methyltransferase [Geminicoccus harenae]
MDTEAQVARHYTHGALERSILDALARAGKDPDRLTAADLAGVDEFHLGWRPSTIALSQDLRLAPGQRVLDVGSGIGGPARYMAEAHGCQVTGIDLTEEFVAVATALTRRCGLADRVTFRQGSGLALPFPDGNFDAATLIHVGMNIERKDLLFREVRRVLRPGGRFGIYDVMCTDETPLPYPMPWAADAVTSFVEPPVTYRTLLGQAGFEVEQEVNRRDFVLARWQEMRAEAAARGQPPLSLRNLVGPAFEERFANVLRTLQAGSIAPIQMIARAI